MFEFVLSKLHQIVLKLYEHQFLAFCLVPTIIMYHITFEKKNR